MYPRKEHAITSAQLSSEQLGALGGVRPFLVLQTGMQLGGADPCGTSACFMECKPGTPDAFLPLVQVVQWES